MIEHWILRDLSRFGRALFFAALFGDFVAATSASRDNGVAVARGRRRNFFVHQH
jgi:hypothetical protein